MTGPSQKVMTIIRVMIGVFISDVMRKAANLTRLTKDMEFRKMHDKSCTRCYLEPFHAKASLQIITNRL